MSTIVILLTLLAAVVVAALILVEIFFIPGIGLLGILGGLIFAGVGFYLIWAGHFWFAIIYGVLCVLLFILGFYILSRKRVISKIELKESITETAANRLPEGVQIGDHGKSISRLALGGTVEVGGQQFEAKSESGFIDQDQPIVVSRVERDNIYVKIVTD